jgi:hypothetical protein
MPNATDDQLIRGVIEIFASVRKAKQISTPSEIGEGKVYEKCREEGFVLGFGILSRPSEGGSP